MMCSIMVADLAQCIDSHVELSYAKLQYRSRHIGNRRGVRGLVIGPAQLSWLLQHQRNRSILRGARSQVPMFATTDAVQITANVR